MGATISVVASQAPSSTSASSFAGSIASKRVSERGGGRQEGEARDETTAARWLEAGRKGWWRGNCRRWNDNQGKRERCGHIEYLVIHHSARRASVVI